MKERHLQIINLVNEKEKVSVQELSELLKLSMVTMPQGPGGAGVPGTLKTSARLRHKGLAGRHQFPYGFPLFGEKGHRQTGHGDRRAHGDHYD